MERKILVPENLVSLEVLVAAIIADPTTAAAEIFAIAQEDLERSEAKDAADKKIISLEAYIQNLEDELLKSAGKDAAAPEPITGVSSETFELDGKEYGFNYPAVLFNGEKITADHVLADPAIQAELVEMGSGFISELE